LALFSPATRVFGRKTPEIGFVWRIEGRDGPPPATAIALPQIINNPSSIINAEASSARIGFVWRSG
jgi:hypothetical protein